MARGLLVAKFGGSLLRDASGYITAAQEVARLRQEGYQVVVVVSAMKGVTDELIEILESPSGWEPRLRRIMERYYSAARGAVSSERELTSVLGELSRLFDELFKLVWAVKVIGEATGNARAAIVSFGERLSAALMAAALRSNGVEAVWLGGREAGIIAEGDPWEAVVDYEASEPMVRSKLLPVIERGVVPVVTGFVAGTREGRIVLLGRGGSDYTATLLARFLGADEVVLYTDVPGVMTADPGRLKNARVIERLSFAEAMELALLGAKRMHPKTFEPVMGTSTRVRITMPGSSQSTLVDSKGGPPPLKAVVVSEGISLVTVVGGGLVGRIGTAAKITGVAARLGINILAIMQPITETRVSLAVRRDSAEKLAKALSEELGHIVSEVEVEDASAVSVVGDGLREPDVSGNVVEKAAGLGGVKSILWAPGSPILVTFVEPDESWAIAEKLHEEVVSQWRID
ncbi:hypothetical protein CF15_01920 [Pyrodictium occultum]|uniref:Aspartokinase n=1 Tax=Pyrodictium occultum TaxID=2309 RepID=A0A0V8RUK6_PYROC|nr:aspartate kinase [Pyrodictium occultum]KSW11610.1 hypothetical protein CF15_01920 [Pyrodictium occultum]